MKALIKTSVEEGEEEEEEEEEQRLKSFHNLGPHQSPLINNCETHEKLFVSAVVHVYACDNRVPFEMSELGPIF